MKLTPKHFELFKKHCKKWQKKLGLTNYRLFYYSSDLDGADAQVESNIHAGAAVVTLNTKWDDGVKDMDRDLERVAFHELCHVLLARLVGNAGARYTTEMELEESEHEIVRRLENLIFND